MAWVAERTPSPHVPAKSSVAENGVAASASRPWLARPMLEGLPVNGVSRRGPQSRKGEEQQKKDVAMPNMKLVICIHRSVSGSQ